MNIPKEFQVKCKDESAEDDWCFCHKDGIDKEASVAKMVRRIRTLEKRLEDTKHNGKSKGRKPS